MRKAVGLILCMCLFVSGCAYVTRGIPASMRRDKMRDVAVGMTKEEMKELMGKPYKTEVYPPNKEVWFYYTEWQSDGYTTDDEFTPIVFESGKVVGWGWGFDFLKNRQQDIKQHRISDQTHQIHPAGYSDTKGEMI